MRSNHLPHKFPVPDPHRYWEFPPYTYGLSQEIGISETYGNWFKCKTTMGVE